MTYRCQFLKKEQAAGNCCLLLAIPSPLACLTMHATVLLESTLPRRLDTQILIQVNVLFRHRRAPETSEELHSNVCRHLTLVNLKRHAAYKAYAQR